jgi:hypothetical protein
VKVTLKKPEPVEQTVIVEMTMDEAKTLRRICYSVGGDPEGRRGHVKDLIEGLDGAGVHGFEGIRMTGNMSFPH